MFDMTVKPGKIQDEFRVTARDDEGSMTIIGALYDQSPAPRSVVYWRMFISGWQGNLANLSGWSRRNTAGDLIIDSVCMSENAPERVRETVLPMLKRVAVQLACNPSISEDEAIVAATGLGFDLRDPIKRMRLMAERA